MVKVIEAKSTFLGIFVPSLLGTVRIILLIPITLLMGAIRPEKEQEKYEKEQERKGKLEQKSKTQYFSFWDLLTPWRILIDANKQHIIVRKRNWHLISVDETTYAFKTVRNVEVKNYIFGADISIRVFAGKAVAYRISKEKAQQIKNLLLNSVSFSTEVEH